MHAVWVWRMNWEIIRNRADIQYRPKKSEHHGLFLYKKKYFCIFVLILINELCKTINSTHNMKSWKLKTKNLH
jgi:hypothetical protein